MQYIGRLMREEADPQAVRDALDAIKLGHTAKPPASSVPRNCGTTS